MQTVANDAFESWKALYSNDVEKVWNTERKELRRAAMVFHVLKQEFARIETNLNCEMKSFKQKVELINDNKKSKLSPNRESPAAKQGLQLHTNTSENSDLNKSPKLNKRQKSSHLKRPVTSPSLLDIQKENKNNKNILELPESRLRPASDDLFNSSVSDSSVDRGVVHNENVNERPKSDAFKTPRHAKQLKSVDVIDSSFIVEETPDKSTAKDLKWNRKISKGKHKTGNSKEKKAFTLTQMFDSFPNQRISVTNDGTGRNAKQIFGVRSNLEETASNDETFFTLGEENQMETDESKIKPLKENIPTADAFFKDYDKIPVTRSTTPQHIHKTETIRRKADRMKLPGWSCSDCKQYYEGLNLSPEELRKKMNACSKHRNKFPLLDQTFKGYWDVAMPPTQESQGDDVTKLQF